jgi:hypothetical protein
VDGLKVCDGSSKVEWGFSNRDDISALNPSISFFQHRHRAGQLTMACELILFPSFFQVASNWSSNNPSFSSDGRKRDRASPRN